MMLADVYEEPPRPARGVASKAIDIYDVPLQNQRKTSPTVLFLSADSKTLIRNSVERHSKEWVKGFLSRKPLPGYDKAYKEGGEYAAQLALATSEESHAIQDACDGVAGAKVVAFLNVRKTEFEKRLTSAKFDIFHYSGHCNGRLGLSLTPCEGACVSMKDTHVSKEEFQETFQRVKRKIDVAVIASCRSVDFARTLVENDLASVAIGTTNQVKDLSTVRFVMEFYKRLLDGGYPDAKALVRKVQLSYAFARRKVIDKDFNVCIFPRPVSGVPGSTPDYTDPDLRGGKNSRLCLNLNNFFAREP